MKLVWSSGGEAITSLGFGAVAPGAVTEPLSIELRSSSLDDGTFQTLYGLSLLLTGPDAAVIQQTWPPQGGGIDISFDRGATFIRFDASHGLDTEPSTYILVPKTACGFSSTDGVLTATDAARFLVRLAVPSSLPGTATYNLQLDAAYDIV